MGLDVGVGSGEAARGWSVMDSGGAEAEGASSAVSLGSGSRNAGNRDSRGEGPRGNARLGSGGGEKRGREWAARRVQEKQNGRRLRQRRGACSVQRRKQKRVRQCSRSSDSSDCSDDSAAVGGSDSAELVWLIQQVGVSQELVGSMKHTVEALEDRSKRDGELAIGSGWSDASCSGGGLACW